MQVTIRTPLRPTEDPQKVRQAITAWWPEALVEETEGQLVAMADAMDLFKERVWELRIIDTVRTALLDGIDGDVIRFRLSKQAAYVGKVSIPAARHALGDLDIKVADVGDLEKFIWGLCPETKDGEIVGA